MDPETTFNLSTVFQSDQNKSIASIGGYPMMPEVDPKEQQEVKDRGCEITGEIIGGLGNKLKSSAFRMLAVKAGASKKLVVERLNEVLLDEEICRLAKDQALTVMLSKRDTMEKLHKLRALKA